MKLKAPVNWPTDKLSKRADIGDMIVLIHPERHPHIWNAETGKWEAKPDLHIFPRRA